MAIKGKKKTAAPASETQVDYHAFKRARTELEKNLGIICGLLIEGKIKPTRMEVIDLRLQQLWLHLDRNNISNALGVVAPGIKDWSKEIEAFTKKRANQTKRTARAKPPRAVGRSSIKSSRK